ncbi:MAG: thiamine phosphate synthase [Acutalibacteraceae bacterium]|nr:thiamine phosphate synthase [Acutalibacteraceae bacterium]
MSDIIVITNRSLCREDFPARIEKIALAHPTAIILREKDLSEKEYKSLAAQVLEICNNHGVRCILHSFPEAAAELNCSALHMPLHRLSLLSSEERASFKVLGASCHSVEDAKEAEKLGCTYITAGHIFDTDCKKGLPGRGLNFLKEVCQSVTIPVYAIGGISADKVALIRESGAKGACVMSGAMTCEDVQKYLGEFR